MMESCSRAGAPASSSDSVKGRSRFELRLSHVRRPPRGKKKHSRRLNAQIEKRLCFVRRVQRQGELLIFDKVTRWPFYLLGGRGSGWIFRCFAAAARSQETVWKAIVLPLDQSHCFYWFPVPMLRSSRAGYWRRPCVFEDAGLLQPGL